MRSNKNRRRGIYVETFIAADIDDVWHATQDPAEHVRWDIRFSTIVPQGAGVGEPVSFTYERRVPFHVVRGTGVSIGERQSVAHGTDGEEAEPTRTSALRFHTRDWVSPIRAGRGYWRYIPASGGTRFITGYDYDPGWGLLDVMVRPILGWATAWSFDRLRVWMETGEDPERWPLISLLWWWRGDRPRASRCLRAPATGPRGAHHLDDAPESLAALPDPGVRQ